MIARVASSPPVACERRGGRDDAARDLREVERHADDAGGCDQHLLGSQPSARAVSAAMSRATASPVAPGARIRAAAVDDDRPRAAAGGRQMLARDDDRRGRRHVRREDRRGRHRPIARDEREIEARRSP